MDEIINVINEIVKYGLYPNLKISNKESDLEMNLVSIYFLSFDVKYAFDDSVYNDFKKSKFPEVNQNVRSNFNEFGWYHEVLDCHKIIEDANVATGDANDDLSDIIYDLLEVKWRKENNSIDDALWYFNLIFRSHTRPHILGLLKFILDKEK